MKTLILYLVLLSLTYFGCDSINEVESRKYVEGDVSFMPKDSVSFEEMIDTVFSFGKIYQIKFHTTKYSTLPEDSLHYINSSLLSSNFVDTNVTTIYYDSLLANWKIYLWIRGFNEEDIADWYNIHYQLSLQPNLTYFGYGLLKVEPGKEKFWIDKLLESGLFEWADYNYLADITHH